MIRVIAALDLFVYFALDVVKSSFRVAYDVLTPTHRMRPGIVRVDISGMTERQLFFMMNLITMTPGSLGIDLSKDRTKLYLHAMYLDGSASEMAQSFEQSYGKKVRRVF